MGALEGAGSVVVAQPRLLAQQTRGDPKFGASTDLEIDTLHRNRSRAARVSKAPELISAFFWGRPDHSASHPAWIQLPRKPLLSVGAPRTPEADFPRD